MHVMKDELDDTVQRVVLPRNRQGQVLRLAHTSTLAGHFGARKTRDRSNILCGPGSGRQ